ncbi:MAG: DUF2384 domain-containing protein [Desulfovibrio sp.]|nr:DUF2384 domain-containing protein [Desulfovibrio sp.]
MQERANTLLRAIDWLNNNYSSYRESCAKLFFSDYLSNFKELNDGNHQETVNSISMCFFEFILSDNFFSECEQINPLDNILTNDGPQFSIDGHKYIEALRHSHLSIYEVQSVHQNKFTAKDLLQPDKDEITLWKPTELRVRQWETIGMRDLQLPAIDIGCCGAYRFERSTALDLCKRIPNELKRNAKLKNPKNPDFFTDVIIIHAWLEYIFTRLHDPKIVVAGTKEELTFITDSYQTSDPEALSRQLSKKLELTAVDTEDEHSPLAKEWMWFQSVDESENTLITGRRILAHFNLVDNILEVSSLTASRANSARELLKDIPEHLLKFSSRSSQKGFPQNSQKRYPGFGQPACSTPGVQLSDEERQEVILQFKKSYFAKWLDQPLPALNGKTPRHAATLKTYRQRVIDLLKTMEENDQRSVEQGLAPFDFSEMWKELGLR